MEASEYFFINITGQIDFAYYPIGFDGRKLFCRYDVVAGPDWELVSGFSSGVTQNASVGQCNDKVVFNMPIEMMFKSTNPFGCKYQFLIIQHICKILFKIPEVEMKNTSESK